MTKFRSQSPVILTEDLNLVEMLYRNQTTHFIPFQKKILWLRSCEATVSLWHGGNHLKDVSSFTDYYGYMTSFESAREGVVNLKKYYSITEKSELEVRIYATMTDLPVTEVPEENLSKYEKEPTSKKCYYEIPREYTWLRNNQTEIKYFEKMMGLLSKADSKYFEKEWELREKLLELRVKMNTVLENQLVYSSITGDTGIENSFRLPLLKTVDQS